MTPENNLSVGTVGWASDGGNAYEMGSELNGGTTLVRVTMFRGKDPTVKLIAGRGQGQQILCQVAADVVFMPPYGARVMVAMPDPNPMTPGHSVIIATLSNSVWKQTGNMGEGDLVIPCPVGPGRIVLTSIGGFAFISTAADGSTFLLEADPSSGFRVAAPFGVIAFDSMGLRGSIGGGPSFKFYNIAGFPPPLDVIFGSIAQISAGTVKIDGPQVLLGPFSESTAFVPTAAYNDGTGLPSPAPLLNDFLSALPALLLSLESLAIALASNVQYTGVNPGLVDELVAAINQVVVGANMAETILTTTCVKVAYPL